MSNTSLTLDKEFAGLFQESIKGTPYTRREKLLIAKGWESGAKSMCDVFRRMAPSLGARILPAEMMLIIATAEIKDSVPDAKTLVNGG